MPLNLLVTSKSSRRFVDQIAEPGTYFDVLVIGEPPKTRRLKKHEEGKVIAIGGGSVIDTAKIIAGYKPCIAIPTTASGAAMTSHAVIWTKKRKENVLTHKPILFEYSRILPIQLDRKTLRGTKIDCLCHILEARNSLKANNLSNLYCDVAEQLLKRYRISEKMNHLIEAGNMAGRAIEIAGTNYFHCLSYVMTIEYGMSHGEALERAVFQRRKYNWKKIIKKARQYKNFKDYRWLQYAKKQVWILCCNG